MYGPTASGKSGFVLEELASVCPVPIEIISADSMQVYRGLDIGTAKPDAADLARLPHHLVDIRNPDEVYDAESFARDALALIGDICARGHLPAVVGGTGFYLRSLVFGLGGAPRSPEIRLQLEAELAAFGPQALRKRLEELDPQAATEIPPNDLYRTLRALEIVLASGKPRRAFAGGAQRREGYRFGLIHLNPVRDELYRRINERCRSMFEAGLREEWQKLVAAGYTESDPGMRAIGYREFFLGLDDGATLELIAKNSRNYAKRQVTFFRKLFPQPDFEVADAGTSAARQVAQSACLALAAGLLDKES